MAAQMLCNRHPEAALEEDHDIDAICCSACNQIIRYGLPDFGEEDRGATETCSDVEIASAKDCFQQLSDALHVPDTVKTKADDLFIQAAERTSRETRRREGYLPAIFAIATRETDCPRTFLELSSASRIHVRDIKELCELLRQKLRMTISPIPKEKYVERFCVILGLNFIIQKDAVHVAKKSEEMGLLFRRTPRTSAAASTYLASLLSNNRKTTAELSYASGISPQTISECYRDIKNAAAIFVPDRCALRGFAASLPNN